MPTTSNDPGKSIVNEIDHIVIDHHKFFRHVAHIRVRVIEDGHIAIIATNARGMVIVDQRIFSASNA